MLDSFESRGDARAAWEAIQFCERREIEFPQWVLDYLSETASRLQDFLDNRDEQGPTRLIYALGFDKLRSVETYDHAHDPEFIYETISTWQAGKEVKTIAAGARRYVDEILGGIGDPDSIRKAFYKGKELWKHPDPWKPE